MKVLIIGMGFAGNLHRLAWRKLGHEVYWYDIIDGSKLEDKISSIDPDILDFCDTPKSRMEYLSKLKDSTSGRKVYVEKPPCRPCDLKLWETCDATPMHNYLFMPFTKELHRLEVVILRKGPHREWYADVDLSGGGILLDHGYHWLYVADSIGVNIAKVQGFIDSYPDFTCGLKTESFNFYATWRSLFRVTVINGAKAELRSEKVMVQSFADFFKNAEDLDLKRQSIRVMKAISAVYKSEVMKIKSSDKKKEV